jgi:DNA helicase-2/ATP-dependent DNA helicase PcrA
MIVEQGDENRIDDGVDDEIFACLDPNKPRSFFLYAGAGSGKTRSLITALDRIHVQYGARMWMHGQRVGVITYTNAACDEIRERLVHHELVDVSTIHSFTWALVGGYQRDIREWLRKALVKDIEDLRVLQAKGKPNSKAARAREQAISDKAERLADLDRIRRFVYNPSGDNRGRDSLSHSEVISMTAALLVEKARLQEILVCKYPVLFIDESQDTNRHLMEAILLVQEQHAARFCLGLFGDMMQRIYADGKVDLGENLPTTWARPTKRMNHRCPGRIIELINRIRSNVDGHAQIGRTGKPAGVIRLFILPASLGQKDRVEAAIADRMAIVAEDSGWASDQGQYKTLILEHHMAARRMGFQAMFGPLYAVDHFRTGLLDGSLPGLRFFAGDVLPLIDAMKRGDRFAAAAVVRRASPLLAAAALKSAGVDQVVQIGRAKEAVDSLMALWRDSGVEPTFLAVLLSVSASGLFVVPDSLRLIAARQGGGMPDPQPSDSDNDTDTEREAWDLMLATPFKQIAAYEKYVSDKSRFGTHQGVKGLEFPRVMVIIDDEEAKGFLFSYDKLFGAKSKSETDLKNESLGGETTIDRTRRLLYVTSSRAERSLAIVAYSLNPGAVKAHVVNTGWFREDEIESVPKEFVH